MDQVGRAKTIGCRLESRLGDHLRGVIIVALTAMIAACEPAAPRQPFGVPRTAAWANGAWVDCFRDEKDEHVFACSIYTKDAKLDAKGTFTLVDASGNRSAAPREPMKFTSWDGALHLDGGRKLVRR